MISAQTDCSQIQSMYDEKVVEIIHLKQEINRLKKDSSNLENRCAAKDAQNKELVEIQRKYKPLEHERDSLRKELRTHENQSTQLAALEDSIGNLNARAILLDNQLDSVQKKHEECENLNKKYYPVYEQQEQFVKWFNTIYASTTIDKLYNESSKEQLLLSRDIYRALNKAVPSVILQTLECFEAKEQCSKKFNKTVVDMKRTSLLKHNSNTSKKLALQLQQYGSVYAEADSLWTVIKNEVCKEEIVEESFSQIQSKRQIWQRTQKFLNKYPNLAHEYPYIYEELQKMLCEIWKNANNFNKIPAPFK